MAILVNDVSENHTQGRRGGRRFPISAGRHALDPPFVSPPVTREPGARLRPGKKEARRCGTSVPGGRSPPSVWQSSWQRAAAPHPPRRHPPTHPRRRPERPPRPRLRRGWVGGCRRGGGGAAARCHDDCHTEGGERPPGTEVPHRRASFLPGRRRAPGSRVTGGETNGGSRAWRPAEIGNRPPPRRPCV